MKVLVATEKPFAAEAVNGIKDVIDAAGHTLVLLEKGTKEDLIKAVADVEGLIVRSDIVDKEVLDAAKQLKVVVLVLVTTTSTLLKLQQKACA